MVNDGQQYICLVVEPHLWKMMEWKSVGMMKFPTEWKHKIHVPNQQAELIFVLLQSMTLYWRLKFCEPDVHRCQLWCNKKGQETIGNLCARRVCTHVDLFFSQTSSVGFIRFIFWFPLYYASVDFVCLLLICLAPFCSFLIFFAISKRCAQK